MTVTDDTEQRPPEVEIWVRGQGSWYPDLTFGGDVRELGEYPVGEAGEFFVYPDGRDGAEVRVEFVMTPEMISGSDRAMTRVEVYDDEVLVWGEAIPGFEQRFDR